MKKKRKRSRSVKERKIKTDCHLCVFFVVAGDSDPHRRRRETEEKKPTLSALFPGCFRGSA